MAGRKGMIIQDLLKLSVKERASDLHIYPGLPPMLRVDGELIAAKDVPALTKEQARDLTYSIMLPDEQKLFEQLRVLDIAVSFPEIGNFRVSALHQLRGVASVFRIVPERVPTFEELNLPPIFRKLLMKTHGLMLVSGPTGSGKTTTLAVMVDFINAFQSSHIITIEDPIEYTYTNKKSAVTQLQVGRDTPTFASALRSALRQDPDVIMVGELRDLESTRLALAAAETGHLVLASVHAGTAPLVISRVVDMFPADERERAGNMLSETLLGVASQVLVKKTAGGRVAAFEIMIATPGIRHMISQGTTASHLESAIQTGGDAGMITMEESLKDLVAKRLISTATYKTTSSKRESVENPLVKKGEGGLI